MLDLLLSRLIVDVELEYFFDKNKVKTESVLLFISKMIFSSKMELIVRPKAVVIFHRIGQVDLVDWEQLQPEVVVVGSVPAHLDQRGQHH